MQAVPLFQELKPSLTIFRSLLASNAIDQQLAKRPAKDNAVPQLSRMRNGPYSEGRSRSTSNNRGAPRSVEFLGESDEKPFRPADVAEPIRVLILDYFAYELCAALAKPVKRLVDVVHGEHDAEVA